MAIIVDGNTVTVTNEVATCTNPCNGVWKESDPESYAFERKGTVYCDRATKNGSEADCYVHFVELARCGMSFGKEKK